MAIKNNIAELQTLIAAKKSAAKLLVVTKNHSFREVKEVLSCGVNLIGENRVQEAKEKFIHLKELPAFKKAEKHLIGHLQSNKAKEAVQIFDVVQSLDSLKLARALNEAAQKADKIMLVLIQVNISEDENKFGVKSENLQEFYNFLIKFQYFKVGGLMTILREYANPELTKHDFLKMKKVFDKFCSYAKIASPVLSMGMSNDFELALECGSNMLRIGSRIFQN